MASDRPSTDRGTGVDAPRGEIRALTGLRIVAAAWVVVFHFHFTPGDAYTPYWQFLRPVVNSGALGVDLFFVLSGFVITLTYVDSMGRRPTVRGTRRFLWARISRVWPVHALITTVFGAWLLYKSTRVADGYLAYQSVQPQVDVLHWLEQVLMVQLWHRPYFDGSSFAGPAWSLSAEWLAYVAFPVVALVLWRLRNAPVRVTGALAVLCLVPISAWSALEGPLDFPFAWFLRIAGGFLAGAFTCLTVRRLQRSPERDRRAAQLALGALLAILAGLWWADWRGDGQAGYGGVVAVLFPVLIGALALSTRGLAGLLGREPMVHGGRISFSLYLVHIPVFEVFWTLMGWYPRIAPGSGLGTLLTPFVLLATLPLAHLLYRYVEEPARRRMRGRSGGTAGAPVPGGAPAVVPPREPVAESA